MNTPNKCDLLFGQAVSCFQQGRLDDAEATAKKVLDISPCHADSFLLLGIVYYMSGRIDEALASLKQVLRIKPEYPAAYNNLGIVLQNSGRLEEALVAFNLAIHYKQSYPEAYNNLGNALRDLSRPKEALDAFDTSIQMSPRSVEPLVNRGNTLSDLYRIREALQAYDTALKLEPRNAKAYLGRGNALRITGRIAEACDDLQHALQLQPNYSEARNTLLYCSNYTSDLSAVQLYELHRRFCIKPVPLPASSLEMKHKQSSDGYSRLRIGYISPDFRHHSVAYFFEPLLRSHNKDAFEVYCYANVKHPDNVTWRLQNQAEHWLSIIDMTDAQVARQISIDDIDILVDLAGYTAGNRLPVFNYRPAPVQVSWLGYPNTTGMDCIDYRITDAIADPAGKADNLHTEALVRLTDGFLCYQPDESAPAVSPLPADITGHITFGSFNNIRKISPTMAIAWSEILRESPNSRLVLKWRGLLSNEIKAHYLGLFAECGIESSRIDLYDWSPNSEYHMALYSQVDISLDTYPYNGTTTICEALWMGVPVVTLRGDRHAARVGASILERIGGAPWVAKTPEDYVEKALQLAGDTAGLAKTRQGLREHVRSSPLCDASGFSKRIEAAYLKMWERYLAGV